MDENKGVIAGLNEKGFGFIKMEGRAKDVFFHAQAVSGCDFKDLKKGDNVTFEGIESTPKGDQAYGVSVI